LINTKIQAESEGLVFLLCRAFFRIFCENFIIIAAIMLIYVFHGGIPCVIINKNSLLKMARITNFKMLKRFC